MIRIRRVSLLVIFALLAFPLAAAAQEHAHAASQPSSAPSTADEAVKLAREGGERVRAASSGAVKTLQRELARLRGLVEEDKASGTGTFAEARRLARAAALTVIEGKATLEADGLNVRLGVLADIRARIEILKFSAQSADGERRRNIEAQIRAAVGEVTKIEETLWLTSELWNRLSEVKGGLIEFTEIAERLRQRPPAMKEEVVDELDGLRARLEKLRLFLDPPR